MNDQTNESQTEYTEPQWEIFGFPAGPLQTNCFVFIDRSANAAAEGQPSPATVIDPSFGAAEIINKAAAENGFVVEQVVLTHGHIDHIRDAGAFDVPVHIHREDRMMLEQPGLNSRMPQLAELFQIPAMKVPSDIREIEDKVTIGGVEFEVHHMPGHSPGSVVFRVPGLVIGGDVLFNGGVGRTDLPGSNPEDMMLSLKRLASEFHDDDVVLPGHGEQTTVGQEKKTNPFLHEVI